MSSVKESGIRTDESQRESPRVGLGRCSPLEPLGVAMIEHYVLAAISHRADVWSQFGVYNVAEYCKNRAEWPQWWWEL